MSINTAVFLGHNSMCIYTCMPTNTSGILIENIYTQIPIHKYQSIYLSNYLSIYLSPMQTTHSEFIIFDTYSGNGQSKFFFNLNFDQRCIAKVKCGI